MIWIFNGLVVAIFNYDQIVCFSYSISYMSIYTSYSSIVAIAIRRVSEEKNFVVGIEKCMRRGHQCNFAVDYSYINNSWTQKLLHKLANR